MYVRQFFSFPNPVNETSARLVAVGVIVQAIAFFAVREGWILVPLVFGFAARVLTGPTMSPLGQFSVRLATPFAERRLGIESNRVPGPPKRFAQGIGFAFAVTAAAGWAVGASWLTFLMLGALVIAASLEAFAAVCLGCIAYAAIWGCDDCDDISERLQQAVLRARETVPTATPAEADQPVPTR